MKKRVRIYKSQNGEGQFLNKAAQFLRKAQMGGTPSVEDLSYPGGGQGQAQELDENQLASLVMQDISNSRPKEEIVVKLVNIYGKDPMEATNFVNQMYAALEQQAEAQKEADDEDEDEEEIKSAMAQDATEENIIANTDDQDGDGFYGDDSNNDIANQTADEDDEVDDDDSDVASQLIMQRGGFMMRAEEGMEIKNQYPIVFPGVEEYLPANMADMLGGGYDVATGQVWQRPNFQAPQTSNDTGISYANMNPGTEADITDESEAGISDEENYDASEFMKGGAYKKGKREYVNSVLKLVKKQLGGDNTDETAKKSDQADPIGSNLRKGILQNYIGTLKNQGELAIAKEQAEQAYDQMMRQQMMQPVQQFPIEDDSLEEAQFGGFFRRRRMDEGVNDERGLFNRQPRLPRGFNYGYPPIESIDVRRSGWFGRPKEYSVNFGPMSSVMPGYGVQGYGPGFYGYGYKSGTKKTPARKIVEDQAVYVNSQSDKDVAAVTPGNEATNKDAKVEEKKTETTATTPTGTTTTTTTATETVKETPKVENSSKTAKETQVKKDVKKAVDNTKVVKPQAAKPEAPVVPREKAPVYFAPPVKSNIVADNTRVVSKVQPVIVPKFDLTKKTKPVTIPILQNQQLNPLSFSNALLIKDPKKRKAAVQKVMFPWMKEEGGIVDNPFSDEYGALQRFVYGGNEDPALAYIDQTDIDYTDSVDTSDPYFRDGGASIRAEFPTDEKILNPKTGKRWTWDEWNSPGGGGYDLMEKDKAEFKKREEELKRREAELTKRQQTQSNPYYQGYPMMQGRRAGTFNTLFPANLAPSYTTKYMGARNAAGQPIPGFLGPNAQIKSIDVHKSGWLTGRPKKYSITFGNETSDPTKQNLITLNQPGSQGDKGTTGSTTVKGQGQLSQKEIARGERQAGRQRPWYAGRKYEQDFEEYELTPEEQKRVDENEARYQANVADYHRKKAETQKIMNQFLNPKAQTPGMTQGQIQDFQQMISNPSGLPDYSSTPPPVRGSQSATTTGSYAAPVGTPRTEDQFRKDYAAGNIEQSQRTKDGMTIIRSTGEPITDEDFENYTREQELEKQYGSDYVPRNPKYGSVGESYESYLDFVNSGQPLGEGMTRNVMTRDEYGRAYGHYNRGGVLRKFIPEALLGGDTPVVYTNNPAMQGVSDVDLISLNPGIQGLQESPLTSFMNLNAPTRYMSNDPKQYTVDPNQAQRHQIEKTYEPEGDVTYDFKVKPELSNAAVQGWLLTGNAAVKSGLGFVDRLRNNKREKEMYKNLTSDNLYATDPSRDRGDYDTNTGLYRPDQMGQTWNSRSKQFGGQNDYLNEDPDYVDGDEVYMTDDEIQDFLARGGEIEYL